MRFFVVAALCLALSPMASAQPVPRGVLTLPDGALAYVPSGAGASAPLVVLLHGAGQAGDAMIARFQADADRLGLVLLAPKSRGATWDVVARAGMASMLGPSSLGGVYRYAGSPDGARIAAAEAALAGQVPTDPAHRVLLGFSDGASFALAYGTGRKTTYSAVFAVAPGLATLAASPARRRPVIVLHGRTDAVLPLAFTAGTIVPALRDAGLAVRLEIFAGGHGIPPEADAGLGAALAAP